MSATRRSASGPGGLNSNVPTSSRKSGSSSAAAPASARRTGGGATATGEGGSGLIVTRGLQAILDSDRKHRKPEEPAPTDKSGKNGKARRRSSGQAPNFVMCYLCGRQFGSSSIDIHRPQCYLKKMIEWERADPAVRGPKPMSPEAHEKMMKERVASATAGAGGHVVGHPGAARLGGSASHRRANDIELYNQIQMDAYTETSLMPCPNCGRTFLPDRLQVHLRSCKPGNTARPVHRNSGSSPNAAAAATEAASNASTNGITKAAASTSAKAGPRSATTTTTERPIRASGSYAVPTSAGPDDVPPASQPSQRTAGAEAGIVSRPRRGYVFPEDAGSDSVPPQAPSAKKPSRGPSLSDNHHALEEVEMRDVVVSDAETEEVKPPSPRADTERRLSSGVFLRGDPDMTGSSAPNRPASMEPSTVLTHHSRSPDEERSAEMSHSVYALSQSRGREHAAGNRPRKQASASAPRTAPMPELVPEPRTEDALEEEEEEVMMMNSDEDSDGMDGAEFVDADGRVCIVVECAPGLDGSGNQQQVTYERRKWAPKKIPLNNVSRFKNVESRLKQQRDAELSMFVPCQFCGRTFVPERLKRHEECCSERNKPPSRRSIQVKARPSSAGATTPRQTKSNSVPSVSTSSIPSHPQQHSTAAAVPAVGSSKVASPPPARPSSAPSTRVVPAVPPPAGPAPALGKIKFCGGCGVRVSGDAQKFCTECGFKL